MLCTCRSHRLVFHPSHRLHTPHCPLTLGAFGPSCPLDMHNRAAAEGQRGVLSEAQHFWTDMQAHTAIKWARQAGGVSRQHMVPAPHQETHMLLQVQLQAMNVA